MKFSSLILVAALSAGTLHGAELFSYSTPDGKSGLRLAWRDSAEMAWTPLDYDFVSSDFGPWGSHKTMFSPRMIVNAADSLWTCTWEADRKGDVIALAVSPDLMAWRPQRYFASVHDLPRDMRPLHPVTPDSATIGGTRFGGYRQEVDRTLIDRLKAFTADRARKAALYAERAADDTKRFEGMKPVTFTATPDPAAAYPITDKLIGIFFEDINYGADGGLYGELVQNRDFEYAPSDNRRAADWGPAYAWTLADGSTLDIDTVSPLHPNNPHYLRLSGPATLANSGYDGITTEKGAAYRLSIAVRARKAGRLTATLVGKDGKKLASAQIKVAASAGWTTATARMKASASASGARLELTLPAGMEADLDMVSLFPEATFHNRKNGLRRDLAQTLADLKPRFVRFPGGCVAHGNGIDNIYDWKGSIGDLEARRPMRNIWNYHQTRGLGYHEYFLFCEDIGAEPLPVVAAGVPCQNSGLPGHHSDHTITTLGQQCGIPMEEMDAYVQDILDLIEYANGDVTTTWGARRAAAGHPEPFNLKYLGVGNEDLISEVFEPRFLMIYNAVRENYPDIKVVGTAGPFYEGSDYEAGWALARQHDISLIDEHYYVSPGWLIHNQDYYDSYPRGGSKVYLGEWAAHLPGRPNNLETALAGALYLTAVERNADVVEMTSYAPLLARRGYTQWRPDMIYFDNDSITLTPDYHVQHLYGNNAGTRYIPSSLKVDSDREGVSERIGLSTTYDEATGEYILKLVNMLPTEARGTIDTAALGVKTTGRVKALRMEGNPADTGAAPHEAEVTLPDITLPPYSFTVIRLK